MKVLMMKCSVLKHEVGPCGNHSLGFPTPGLRFWSILLCCILLLVSGF